MPVIRELYDETRGRIGEEETVELGCITAVDIRRYAGAIGEDNPIHHDPEYARRRGHADVVAPLNMVPSIVEWGAGTPRGQLLTDGTAGGHLLGVSPAEDVRIMGGGEEMEFYRPVVAGTRLILQTTLVDVTERETKTGPMIVLHYRNRYRDEAGTTLLTCHRTVLLR